MNQHAHNRVATAQGKQEKQGIWLSFFLDREFRECNKIQGKHREFVQGRENESFFGLSYGTTSGERHLQIKICYFFSGKYTGKIGS